MPERLWWLRDPPPEEELPDEIRGYEHVKMDNVARFRERAQQLIAQIN